MNSTLIVTVLAAFALGFVVVSWVTRPPDPGVAAKPAETTPGPKATAPEVPLWTAVLGVTADASAEQIRDAYQRQRDAYDPSKVASLGADIRALAERRSKEIALAFEQAMAERGTGA